MARHVNMSEELTHTHTRSHIRTAQTEGCDKVSRQRCLACGSPVLRGMVGENTATNFVCVCVCVLNLCPFSATLRDSGLRTISDITHGSHVTTQGHYIQNTGLMIAGCTVEGVRTVGSNELFQSAIS